MKSFNAQPHYSNAECVITACMLLVMLAMGASTLFTPEGQAAQVTAGAKGSQVVQSQHPTQIKKS